MHVVKGFFIFLLRQITLLFLSISHFVRNFKEILKNDFENS